MKRRMTWLSAGFAIFLLGCGHQPEQYTLPDQITDFKTLYAANCAGCHGPNGRNGAAHPLNDALYIALIGKEKLRALMAEGVPQTGMSAFAKHAGGTLTDQQLSILADEIEGRWSRPHDFVGVELPAYSASLGDVGRGAAVFHTYCASCHGEDGLGSSRGGPVVNIAYLELTSDQSLRTAVISGRGGQTTHDWRSYSSGRRMTPQEISDVVAWLASHRAPQDNLAKGGINLP